MIPKKPGPELIRAGYRFLGKIMRKQGDDDSKKVVLL